MADNDMIFGRLAKVMKEVKTIEKDRQSGGGGNYKFRGIDDMYNALHDLLAKHEIACVPSIKESVRSSYQTSKGTTMQCVTTTVKYRYYAPDGSYVDSECIGEGADVSDKATSKSLAMAHKYNLVQMFLIKTDDKDDVEAHDIEGAAARMTDKSKPAPKPTKKTDPLTDGNLIDPPTAKGDATEKQVSAVSKMLYALGFIDDHDKCQEAADILGFNQAIGHLSFLSKAHASIIIPILGEHLDDKKAEPPTEETTQEPF